MILSIVARIGVLGEFAAGLMPIWGLRAIRRRRKVAVCWLPDFVHGWAKFIF